MKGAWIKMVGDQSATINRRPGGCSYREMNIPLRWIIKIHRSGNVVHLVVYLVEERVYFLAKASTYCARGNASSSCTIMGSV